MNPEPCRVEVVEHFTSYTAEGKEVVRGRWRLIADSQPWTPSMARLRAGELRQQYGAARITGQTFEVVALRNSLSIRTR